MTTRVRQLVSALVGLGLWVLSPAPVAASDAAASAQHADPIAGVLLALAVILAVAKLGGSLAMRFGQPSVLGELLGGVVLGNLSLLGFGAAEPLESDGAIDMLARLGVIILLFEVGLESSVSQMLKVGLSSFAVALVGVIAPFGLGYLASAWLLPHASHYVHMFLAATLTATSVGITARVLKDLGSSQTDEARIILGAAVIDDVLGLVVLAVVSGSIAAADSGGSLSSLEVALTLFKAVAFLVGALWIGGSVSPRIFSAASRLHAHGVLLALGLAFCFALSWSAGAIGLAPIVGAFAAGLVLEPVHYRDFVERGEHGLDELLEPLSAFLVPVFFVLMGMRTDLRSFAQPGALTLAAALSVCAILGKQACGLAVIGRGFDRLSVGIGMIPRGEVGLIFANIGLSLAVHGERIVSTTTYSAVVAMVIATTMLTPPALKWSLRRRR